jgi:hypothetical protein
MSVHGGSVLSQFVVQTDQYWFDLDLNVFRIKNPNQIDQQPTNLDQIDRVH